MNKSNIFKTASKALFTTLLTCDFLSAAPITGYFLPPSVKAKTFSTRTDTEKCKRGKRGKHGERGKRGKKGNTGSQGPQGIQGVQGPQGIPGVLSDAYISSYFDGNSASFLDDFGPYSITVNFDTDQEPPVDISRTGSTFTVAETGTYLVTWNLSALATEIISTPRIDFVLFNVTTNTDYAPLSSIRIAVAQTENVVSGQMIIPITAAGTELELHCNVTLGFLSGVVKNPSLSIIKIAD